MENRGCLSKGLLHFYGPEQGPEQTSNKVPEQGLGTKAPNKVLNKVAPNKVTLFERRYFFYNIQ